jgi:hypothetical protein
LKLPFKLFFNKKKALYYLQDEDFKCKSCDKPLTDFCHILSFPKGNYLFCKDCHVNVLEQNISAISCKTFATIISKIPAGSVPIFKFLPDLSYGRMSTIEAALDKNLGGKIIDHTKYALRESIEGAQIGSDPTDRIRELDKPLLTEKQGIAYLQNLKNAEITLPALPDKGKTKLIENKRVKQVKQWHYSGRKKKQKSKAHKKNPKRA